MLKGTLGLVKIAYRVLERRAKTRILRSSHPGDPEVLLDQLLPGSRTEDG